MACNGWHLTGTRLLPSGIPEHVKLGPRPMDTDKLGGVVKVKGANLGAQSPVFFPQLEWAVQQPQAFVLSAWPSGRVHAHNPPVIPQVVLT